VNFDSVLLSYQDFKDRLLSVSDPQAQALFAVQYGAYARVGEIVRGRYKKNPPITINDIKDSAKFVDITILTEKTYRKRFVPVSKEIEGWLTDIILDWTEATADIGREVLFPYSTWWAQKRFKKWFGTYKTHYLRHWATTHTLQGFRTDERLQPDEIARLGGLEDLNTFYKVYSHWSLEDIRHKIGKKEKGVE